jgi:Zn finger protein HypA/HybF involved in hydrogenase expression
MVDINDEKVKQGLAKLSASVKAACNEPALRKYLDDKKRLPKERLFEMISKSKVWSVANLDDYKRLTTKNIEATCSHGHSEIVSIQSVIDDKPCQTCSPGKRKRSFKPFKQFVNELLAIRREDEFMFDESTYNSVSRPMSIKCVKCKFEFEKMPKQLIYEKIGCPRCANKAKVTTQRKSWHSFLKLAKERHGDSFEYFKNEDDRYGNADSIKRRCKGCDAIIKQSIPDHLFGNGCKTCSNKRKQTTESFITLSKEIWGKNVYDYSQVVFVNNKMPVKFTCKNGHAFTTQPLNHLDIGGCPTCNHKKFKCIGETEWLDSLKIPENCRNVWINVNGQKLNVSGLINQTIYEYHGDYWRGNLARFAPNLINNFNEMTMQELNDYTLEKEKALRDAGFVVITMWESKWIELRKTRPKALLT